jgi:hypothetical protein
MTSGKHQPDPLLIAAIAVGIALRALVVVSFDKHVSRRWTAGPFLSRPTRHATLSKRGRRGHCVFLESDGL